MSLLDFRQRISEFVAKEKPTTLRQLMAEGTVEPIEHVAQRLPAKVHGDWRSKGQ